MIYLIDDKKTRQKDFGWTEEKFAQYASYLTPLYNIDDVANIGENLYNDGNIILYHESFLDFTGDRDMAVEQRNKLTEKAAGIKGLSVAFFSGSQSSRSLHENVANLPVAIVYQNLEVLIQKYKQQSKHLKYLLFGETPEIEEKLNEKLAQANREIESDAAVISGNNLFIRPNSRYIQNAIGGATEGTIFTDVSDEKLSEKINEWLAETVYDNIFIPLCFGQTLSDYNGLRLATHIRCIASPNQLKRIFIYSFFGIDYLLDNEYFNILKTKNVQLVTYSKKAFESAVNVCFTSLKQEYLSQEINKLKLDPLLNYADSHSVANEWAIHQWAKTIECDETDELAKVFQNVETNLYFKYLRTTNPISEIDRISPEKLKINCEGKPKVLLIDDEAEKGWYEIFAYLLGDINEVYTDYLGDDFKSQSQEVIIDKSLQRIEEDDIDVVILDFRLNPNDFIGSNPKDISSIRLLKKIKGLNPGIQVIVFSATNKVWNLQALQEAGADGFVIKGAPKNSGDSKFTVHSINNFVNLTSDAFSRIFLKDFYKLLFQVRNNITACEYEDGTDYEAFLMDLQSHIKIIEQAGTQVKSRFPISLDVVFLNCYNFLDVLKNQYVIEKDYRFYLGIEEIPLHRYEYNQGSLSDIGEFIRNSGYDKPSWFQSMTGLLIDYFQVVDLNDDSIKTLWQIKNWRNKYIHEDKSHFSQSEVLKIVDLMVKLTSSMKE